jgi:ribosomal protein L11 methyltransferase
MIRLAVRAAAEDAERVLEALLELAPAGVEEVDGDGWVEYAVYGAPGELPSLPAGDADVGGARVRISGTEVPDDWAERWRRFHHPVLVGGKLWVRPPWAERAVRPGVREIVIDPGRAFGTGSHPTTRMSLELLLEVKQRGSLADLGCGSGVLAIAAAALGFSPVIALDSDRLAIQATRQNAGANGVRLDVVAAHDLRRVPPPVVDVIAANLVRSLLLRVAGLLSDRAAPELPRALVVSGLLDEEADEVGAAFAPLRVRSRRSDQGWTALLLERA